MTCKDAEARKSAWAGKLASAIIGIVALLGAAPCAAAVFSQVIVFGDSSVDSGFYRALPSPGGGNGYNAYWPAAVANGAGVPTSSPGLMYPQVLASYFGLTADPSNKPGGTNYATSGAKNVDINTSANGGFKSAVPTVTQIANYLGANGGRADPSALYLISSGGNDVGFAYGHTGTGPYPSDPAAYLTNSANGLATAIASLMAAGARRFIVAMQQPAASVYSQALLASLNSKGVPFIAADTYSKLVAIMNNPAAYGFTSTSTLAGHTACTVPPGLTTAWGLLCSSNPNAPSTFSSPNADQTNLFADDEHLATAGQRIMADYVYSLIMQTPTLTNYSDSWWNANESGWGITITDHGSNAFVQWYTYDQSGHNQKYVIAGGTFSSDRCRFSGTITHATGPSWTLPTFDPTQVVRTTAGSGTIDFCPTGLPAGTIVFNYTADGVSGSKQLTRLSFGNDVPHWGGMANTGASDFTDLWWNPAESGWGVSVTQHGNNIFFRIFVYDTNGLPLLFIVPGVTFTSPTSFTGALQTATGPWLGNNPFDPNQVVRTTAGTATLTFSDANNGVLSYTVNGVTKTKPVTRMAF